MSRQPADSVTVYAPAEGAAAYDAGQPYEVVRHRTSLMLPEPFVIRRARELMRTTGASRVLYGAAAPLGLISDALRGVGAEHIVGLTHGHEAAWAARRGAARPCG